MRFPDAKVTLTLIAAGGTLGSQTPSVQAAPAPLIAYQGRLEEAGLPVTGIRSLSFALVDAQGAAHWNSGTQAVSLNNGLYAILLGGTGMPAIPTALLGQAALKLRLTVNGTTLSPDVDLVAAFQARGAWELLGTFTGDLGGTQNATTPGKPAGHSPGPRYHRATVGAGAGFQRHQVGSRHFDRRSRCHRGARRSWCSGPSRK